MTDMTIAEMEARKLERRREIKARYRWDGTGLVRRRCRFCGREEDLFYTTIGTICSRCMIERDCWSSELVV